MRRSRVFVLMLALVFPVAASAGGPDGDPNGLVAQAPAAADWLESVVRVLVAWIGI